MYICDTCFYVCVHIHTLEWWLSLFGIRWGLLNVMTTFRCEVRLSWPSVLHLDQMGWPVFCLPERKSAAGWEQYQGPCPTTVPLTSVLDQRNCESLVGGSWQSTWHLNFWCSNVSSTNAVSFLLYFSLHHMFPSICAFSCVCKKACGTHEREMWRHVTCVGALWLSPTESDCP